MLFVVLNRTRLGMRIRAGTLDLETVSVLGVNVRILRSLNFGLGIFMAGLAGVLAAGMLGLQPTIRMFCWSVTCSTSRLLTFPGAKLSA